MSQKKKDENEGLVDKIADKLSDGGQATAGLAGEQQEANLEGDDSTRTAKPH